MTCDDAWCTLSNKIKWICISSGIVDWCLFYRDLDLCGHIDESGNSGCEQAWMNGAVRLFSR